MGYEHDMDPRDPYTPTSDPAPMPPPAPPPPSYAINGTPSQALIDALYPGYKVVNGQWQYGGEGQGSISNPLLAANYLNQLWGPLSSQDYAGFWNATGITKDDANAGTIAAYAPILRAAGFKLNPNAKGEFTDFYTPNGRLIDPLEAQPGGSHKWAWNDVTDQQTNGQLGPLLQPFTEPAPSYTPPSPFSFAGFTPTSVDDVFADPSFEFSFGQGRRALMNSFSREGTLRGGPTYKAMMRYGQDYGSTKFGDIDERRFRNWAGNRGLALDSYNTNYKTQYADPWQHAWDTWGKDFDIYKWNKTWPYDVLSDQQKIGMDAARS